MKNQHEILTLVLAGVLCVKYILNSGDTFIDHRILKHILRLSKIQKLT